MRVVGPFPLGSGVADPARRTASSGSGDDAAGRSTDLTASRRRQRMRRSEARGSSGNVGDRSDDFINTVEAALAALQARPADAGGSARGHLLVIENLPSVAPRQHQVTALRRLLYRHRGQQPLVVIGTAAGVEHVRVPTESRDGDSRCCRWSCRRRPVVRAYADFQWKSKCHAHTAHSDEEGDSMFSNFRILFAGPNSGARGAGSRDSRDRAYQGSPGIVKVR